MIVNLRDDYAPGGERKKKREANERKAGIITIMRCILYKRDLRIDYTLLYIKQKKNICAYLSF